MSTVQQKRELRAQGLTYREIAAELGISFQAVAQTLSKEQPSRFRYVTKDACVYAGLRNWMNENKITKSELIRKLGLLAESTTVRRVGNMLRGETYPRKDTIDKLIKITGLTYEELFRQEAEE